jgi:pimeloyl-ACP methyl ester carboxylesterase
VLDAVGSEHPVLTGISESGAPNALLAATRPNRVQSMVWLEPNPRCAWAPDYPWGRKPEDLEAEFRNIELWGTLAYGRWLVQDEASRDNEMPPDSTAARMAKATRNACTPDVARDLAKLWYETDVRAVLSAIQVPTLLLSHPERKNHFDCAKYVTSLIPGAELKEIPGTAWSAEAIRSIAEKLRLRRRPDFPSPVDRWARGDLWAAADIGRWASRYEGGEKL